jgi:DNA-binding response OmpR family regulator
MSTILIVEDDARIRANLSSYLRKEGFEVAEAESLSEANNAFDETIQLIILDWMLPDGQGIEWIPQLRAKSCFVPVILLTARTDMIDKVVGLEVGADDYIIKPFDPRELVARIRVQLRHLKTTELAAAKRSPRSSELILEFPPIRMDVLKMEVRYHQKVISLAKMEFDLLKFFMENPERVFTRDDILSAVWGFKYPTTRTVDTHVLKLRRKLGTRFFETIHGTGYCFKTK